MTNENGDDGVEAGIREWRRTKADAEAAIEKARVAEADATFVRGQLEVLEKQKKQDDAKIHLLQGNLQELEILIDTLGSAVLSILEKRKAGMFRAPGSIRDGGERVKAVRDRSSEASGDGDRNAELGAEGQDRAGEERSDPATDLPLRPGKMGKLDLRKLESDIAGIPKFLNTPREE